MKEEADREASKVDPKFQLSERNRIIATRYRNESDEVKEAIKQKRAEMLKEREETMAAMQSLFSDDADRERTPDEYLR